MVETKKEERLLSAFAFLILLILLIGLVGISQIKNLHRRIESLGKYDLRLENAVFEMRVNNTIPRKRLFTTAKRVGRPGGRHV